MAEAKKLQLQENIVKNKYKSFINTPDYSIVFGYTNLKGNHFKNLELVVDEIVFMIITYIAYKIWNTKKTKQREFKVTEIEKLMEEILNNMVKDYKQVINSFSKIMIDNKIPKSVVENLFGNEVDSTTALASLKKIITIIFFLHINDYAKKYPSIFIVPENIKRIKAILFSKLSNEFYETKPEYFIRKVIGFILKGLNNNTIDYNKFKIYYNYVEEQLSIFTKNSEIISKDFKKSMEETIKTLIEYRKKTGNNVKEETDIRIKPKDKESEKNGKMTALQELEAKRQKLFNLFKELTKLGVIKTNITNPKISKDETYFYFLDKTKEKIEIIYKQPTNHKTILLFSINDWNYNEVSYTYNINMSNPYLKEYTLKEGSEDGKRRKTSWEELLQEIRKIINLNTLDLIEYLYDKGDIKEKPIEISSIGIDSENINNIINHQEFQAKDEEVKFIDWDMLLDRTYNPIIRDLKTSYAETFREVEILLNDKLENGKITEQEKNSILLDIILNGVKKEYKHIFFNKDLFKEQLKEYFTVRKFVIVNKDIETEVSRKIELPKEKGNKKMVAIREINKILNLTGHYMSIKYKLNIFEEKDNKRKKIATLRNDNPLQNNILNVEKILEQIKQDNPDSISISGKIHIETTD